MNSFARYLLISGLIIFNVACSSIVTRDEFYKPLINDLKKSDYKSAAVKVLDSTFVKNYSQKDLLLFYLDRGIVSHYSGEYEVSNDAFSKAEDLIDEYYTKSISKGAVSLLLNDNALDYSGEVYENLYINIFKALNYIHLKKYDEAYVECKRVNEKLSELENNFDELVNNFNSDAEAKIKINPVDIDYYSNVLANYLSYIIFQSEAEEDNSRISKENILKAWNLHSAVYNYHIPDFIYDSTSTKNPKLVLFSFLGNAPVKQAVGARITTFDDYVIISDPTNFHTNAIPFPGSKFGYNFKFEFPQLYEEGTNVKEIEIYVDSVYYGKMQLLENMANVARKTFESKKSIIFFKTIMRALAKGFGANAVADKLKKGSNEFLGDVISLLTNAVVDATENADLRSWRTLPSYCLAMEIRLPIGVHNILLKYIDVNGIVIRTFEKQNVKIGNQLNLIEDFYLN